MKTRQLDRRNDVGIGFAELGFGSAPLGNFHLSISDDEADQVLEAAWDNGVRNFDTAPLFGLGLSERRVGRFLAGKPRDEFVISTKIGRLLEVCLPDQGVVKAIGGGNNEWEVCQMLVERGDFDLFLLAGRYSLLKQEALGSFLPLCEQHNIVLVLGGTYNSGILAEGPVKGAQCNYSDAPDDIIERVRQIEAVCNAHGLRLIEAALNFPFIHPAVVSVIPGGQRPEQVASNAAMRHRAIPYALWAELNDKGQMRADAPVPATGG